MRVRSIAARAIIRWAGSKRSLLPKLAPYWSTSFDRYIEPFAGSAKLFFMLQPPRALLGDANRELINAYRVLRESPDALHAKVSRLPVSSRAYYRIRRQIPKDLGRFDRAARFIYLNRLCFNGIYRTNTRGQFNVPYGASTKRSPLPPIEEFRKCALQLEKAALHGVDYSVLLRQAGAGDFVYLDPPYAVRNRRIFCEYGSKEFTLDDLNDLSLHLIELDSRKAKFLLSYADCIDARRAFRAWSIRRVLVRRHVAGFASLRRHSFELLVTNISD